MVSYPQLSSAISKHFGVCHETTLNFPEHELFHLTWLGREWARLGSLLTIGCFSLDQTFNYAPIFGPALAVEVGTKAGPVASKARSRLQIWDLCQTEGKRTADCRWECRRTEGQMGEGTCPASYGKMVASWDAVPRPSLPCPLAARGLLLPLPKRQDHHTCLAWVWLRHWRVFQAFLVYESSYSSTGFFLEDNWLQRDSHSFCFIHLFSPEHLTQFLAFNRYSIDSHWMKK